MLQGELPAQLGVGALSELREPPRMQLGVVAGVGLVSEPLDGELTDRLEHPEAVAGVSEEALVDKRLKDVQVGVNDLFGRVEGAAASEDGEAGEELLLAVAEQVV